MDGARLFNCCTNHAAPDWSQFDGLEIGGCITVTDEDSGATYTEGGQPADVAEFFTVYGHLKEGGCEAITDCATSADACAVADELTALTGLQVTA